MKISFLFLHTAWTYMNEMWDEILTKYYPSISYVFMAEEPGSEIYVNTDLEGSIYSQRFSVENINLINNPKRNFLKSLKRRNIVPKVTS